MITVGYYGGSFNPPHIGHALVPAYLSARGAVERIVVAPCWEHAFAKELASFADRLAWTRAAMRCYGELVEVSDVEARWALEHGRMGRTYEILDALAARHPSWKLRLVVGSDILASGETSKWYRWGEIVRRFDPIVIPRSGWVPLGDVALPEVSSTRVRELLAQPRGQDRSFQLAQLLPKPVLDLIDHREGEIVLVGNSRAGQALESWLRDLGFLVKRHSARELLANSHVPGVWKHARGVWIVAADPYVSQLAAWMAKDPHLPRDLPVYHACGAKLAADVLAPLANLGQPVATIHPICSMVGPGSAVFLRRSYFGLEGHPDACERARQWLPEARILELDGVSSSKRTQYHASCSLAAGYLSGLWMEASSQMALAGAPVAASEAAILGLLQSAIGNLARYGRGAGISGPLARGDTSALGVHLDALSEPARSLYASLLAATKRHAQPHAEPAVVSESPGPGGPTTP